LLVSKLVKGNLAGFESRVGMGKREGRITVWGSKNKPERK